MDTQTAHHRTDENHLPDNRRGSLVCGLVAFKRFVTFLLIVALVLLVCLLFLKDQLDGQIQKTVERQLDHVFSATEVAFELDSAEYHRGTGIRLTGLEFAEKQIPFLDIDEIYVKTGAEVWDLVSGKVQPSAVVISGLNIELHQEQDGSVNLLRILKLLKPPVKKNAPPNRFILKNCSMLIHLQSLGPPIEVRLSDAEIRFGDDQNLINLSADLESDFCRKVRVSGTYNLAEKKWNLWGNAKRLSITPEIFVHLPESLQKQTAAVESLRAKLDFDFEVSGSNDLTIPPQFVVTGKLSEGSFSDPRIPFPIISVNADFDANNRRVKIENVTAQSPIGTIELAFKSQGITLGSPFELVARMNPLYVDRRLGDKLPAKAQEFLNKYSPEGNLRLNAKFAFQNGEWIPDVRVELLDMSFAFFKFPYPVTNATGLITLDNEKITVDVSARASGREVKIDGHFLEPGPNSHGTMTLVLQGQIPIDDKVMTAMEQMPDILKTIKSFHPRGEFGFTGRMTRVKQENGGIDERFYYRVPLQNVEATYDRFPLPFRDVSGLMEIIDGKTYLRDFRGKNVSSDTFGFGTWDQINGLDLTVESSDIELNNSLKAALPKQVRDFWNGVNPTGALSKIRATLKARPRQPLDYIVNVETGGGGPGLTAIPEWFPYEMKEIKTQIAISPNRFWIKSFKGKHRKTSLTMKGEGSFGANGWDCQLRDLFVDRLTPDRELTTALPKSLGDTIQFIELKGLFNLSGNIRFETQYGVDERGFQYALPLITNWDLTADVDRGSFLCGIEIEDVYGAIRLTGNAKGEEFQALGGMDIDSVVWNEIQFKRIRSPVYLDNHEALLGLWATAKQKGSKPEPLSCQLFGGKLAGNGRFSLHGDQPFSIQATLNNADLKEFTFELAPEYTNVVGRAFGGFRVNGNNVGSHSLRGEGELRLVDAKISEVPVMLGMLKLLSVNHVDRTLFNESNVDFTIQGEHVFFNDLEFLGDAISLKGNGEMDFDQNIELQFYTSVGRGGFKIPIISPILGAASQQILVIDVKGTTQDPVIKKNFFKMLNEKLKENLDDLEDSIEGGSDTVRSATGRPFGNLFR